MATEPRHWGAWGTVWGPRARVWVVRGVAQYMSSARPAVLAVIGAVSSVVHHWHAQ
ncbi:hypothetical protein CHLRE_04g217958v5 [Chlamydomonas reinhardtii]|uniref:Uncharacterized protein n=1 Tax=Chlamydomonas reinhardtii TaxID=3055 RepID=A0A2K3DTK1_CHLRE|nr:uncharacterized protein CHLRE_04g217958v5 [Chlamydomonas reinhardtii]PNW83857.1 hypothetical protein CHLRE_04g217958v5 [Chlamydomonas reinhardtii]